MKLQYYAIGALSVVLTACSTTQEPEETAGQSSDASESMQIIDVQDADRRSAPLPADYNGEETDSFGAVGHPRIYSSVQGAYKGRPLTRHVGDYVKNLTQDLISNMEYVTAKTPVAVTNFALLDSDLQQTNLLGQQMAESFVHELHKFRIPVLDYKATDYIRVTKQGDFLLSRDYLDLNASLPIEYVLTGTMAKHQGGVMVNARILGIESRAVVASAQMLIPFYVVDALIPSDGAQQSGTKDGVKLTQG